MKKKLFAALLALTLAFGLGACGSAGNKPEEDPKPGVEQDQEGGDGQTTEGGVDTPTDGGIDGTETPDEDSSGGGAAKPPTQTGGGKPGGGTGESGSPGNTAAKPPISGSFSDIIKSVYDKVGYDVSTAETEVTPENAEYYLGSGDIKFKQALASEPMMSSIAHSVVLLEAEDGADIAAIKKSIKKNVNGYKWVCVGVEGEDILAGNVGNYIMLVMDEDAQSFMDAFLAMG